VNDIHRPHPLNKALAVVLWALVAVVVLPAGACGYVLFHTERWKGELPAVVTGVDGASDIGTAYYYSVDFTGPPPPEALTVMGLDYGVVPREPGDLRPGDAVVCRVVQTYTMNTNFDTGPQTVIESCRAA
jgi:hypothetical protein